MTCTKPNPESEIPDLSGKVIFITGGNAGLGKETARVLSEHKPKHIFLGARSAEKCQAAISEIQASVPDAPLTFIQCDLASLSSVVQAAKAFTAQSDRLDILYLNAGIMAVPPGLTTDGYEIQFGTNHLGHALLLKLLLPTLLRTASQPGADVRVISLSSAGFRFPVKGGIQFDNLRTTMEGSTGARYFRYGQSKLANVLYAAEVARRYPQLTSVSIHPGVVSTGLADHVGSVERFWLFTTAALSGNGKVALKEGAKNQLWAGTTAKKNVSNGAYYEPVAVKTKLTDYGKDENLARKLWEWTDKELEKWNID